MKDITKIVVPIDLDRHTKKLVEFSVYVAEKFSAGIRFIHVVENIATGDMMIGSPSFEPIYEEQARKAKIAVDGIIEDNRTVVGDMDGVVIRGDIVEEVVKYADTEDAGLLIIGTHGARGLERILLGSVAERVLKSVHCPTLTMNPYK
ncbi:hypothetical protein DGMP_02450 [Desulfomarina profundi]|uniref:Universal stress protein n=1 Tax=Desulfomarina profundi TaxID=2772557 RepID=A0A8D5FTF1_9BACT|nr:universal stress protein [Desulfomarina profundi]BCL59552.1 hypothetical protein DGMP_02450 [Desulfomarina profundi]